MFLCFIDLQSSGLSRDFFLVLIKEVVDFFQFSFFKFSCFNRRFCMNLWVSFCGLLGGLNICCVLGFVYDGIEVQRFGSWRVFLEGSCCCVLVVDGWDNSKNFVFFVFYLFCQFSWEIFVWGCRILGFRNVGRCFIGVELWFLDFS